MDNHTEYLIFINQNLKNFLSLLIHFILKADKELSQNSLTHLNTIMSLYNQIYGVSVGKKVPVVLDQDLVNKLKIYEDTNEFFQKSYLPCIKMLYEYSSEMEYTEYFNNLKLGVGIMSDYKEHLTDETWTMFFDTIFEPFLTNLINEIPKKKNQTPERHRGIQKLILYGVKEMIEFVTGSHNQNTLLLVKYLGFLKSKTAQSEKNVINTLFENVNFYITKLLPMCETNTVSRDLAEDALDR